MSRLKGVSAVLVLLCLGLFAYGCGGNDEVTQDDIDEAIQQVEERQQVRELQKRVKQLQKRAKRGTGTNSGNSSGQGDGYYEGGSGSGGPVSSCGAGVQVGPNTSCAFAMNVAGEYGSNPGAGSISAYSPVTGEYYSLSCRAWSGGTVCTGGNDAAVYLP